MPTTAYDIKIEGNEVSFIDTLKKNNLHPSKTKGNRYRIIVPVFLEIRLENLLIDVAFNVNANIYVKAHVQGETSQRPWWFFKKNERVIYG